MLGVEAQKDIDDCRNLRSSPFWRCWKGRGAHWKVVDPHVPEFKFKGQMKATEKLTAEMLAEADLVLITTDHSCFDYDLIAAKQKWSLIPGMPSRTSGL